MSSSPAANAANAAAAGAGAAHGSDGARSDLAIKVQGLGKSYVIAHQQRDKHLTLGELIMRRVRDPLGRRRSASAGASTGAAAEASASAAAEAQAARETFWALKDINFDVRRGEVVGIIGRNGAGKSTLLKVLSRITEPTEGRIDLWGRVGSLLEVGTGFHRELTGRENIYLNGSILGMRKGEIDRVFDEIVEFSGVERFLDTPVKRYSSGMYVRLAFAVAAHLEPEILIVDEVLAVGDAAFQQKCLGKMHDVAHAGRTVLFVSHNMAAMRLLCNRLVWLKDGRVFRQGPTAELADAYLEEVLGETAREVSLEDAPREERYGHLLKMTALEFNGGEPIRHGMPLTMRVSFKTFAQPLDDVVFAIGLSSPEGVRLMTIDAAAVGRSYRIPPHTTATVEARIENLELQPGLYLLDPGVRGGPGQRALDYVKGCSQVQVLPGPRTPATFTRAEGGGGGVRLSAEWGAVEPVAAHALVSP